MPQFTMMLVTDEDADRLVERGAELKRHEAGQPVKRGGGNETYRCGSCKTLLLQNVDHHDAHGALIRCGKCGRVNREPPH